MDSDDVKAMQCVARVMAIAVATAAKIEGMKATNFERRENGYALAYDEVAFTEVENELMQSTRSEIGL